MSTYNKEHWSNISGSIKQHTDWVLKKACNPFLASVVILYAPWEPKFSGVFRGYKMAILARNGLIKRSCPSLWNWNHQLIFIVL